MSRKAHLASLNLAATDGVLPVMVAALGMLAFLSAYTPSDLVRVSMALRGVRPSVEELARVENTPEAFTTIVDGYLESSAFGDTIRDLHNDALLVRTERLTPPPKGKIRQKSLQEINASISEAPLKLIEHVVMNNRPYTEIVTADYVLADDIVSEVWGLKYSGDREKGQWQSTQWTDGRGRAGVLSSSALFLRHRSTFINANRGRANMVSRALLCRDFLDREIEIDGGVNLSDPAAVKNAVTENPACVGCHQTLDPLAGFFAGYRFNINPRKIRRYPIKIYRPRRERRFRQITGREPGYFGKPANGLGELGDLIAADPQFSLCAARRFYGYFHHVDPSDVDLRTAATLQKTLIESGYNAKTLVRAIVTSRAFLDAPLKKARPRQVASAIEDWTGYRWENNNPSAKFRGQTIGTIDLPTSDIVGYRVIGGGIDSFHVTQAATTVNTTSSLFLQRFAERAADHIVDTDLPLPESERRLLRDIRWIHLRLFGNTDDVALTEALYRSALATSGSERRAWKVTLTALFQDLRVAYY